MNRYAKRKAAGLCVDCRNDNVRPALPKKTHCQECHERSREYAAKALAEKLAIREQRNA